MAPLFSCKTSPPSALAAAALIMPIMLSLSAPAARAQVTLRGSLDEGLTYLTNDAGQHSVSLAPNIMWKSEIVFHGEEDLGDGNQALFEYSQAFTPSTGYSFGGSAYVGLSNRSWGSFKVGTTTDSMIDVVSLKRVGRYLQYMPTYYLSAGPFDRLGMANGAMDFNGLTGRNSFNNGLTYNSPTWDGAGFEAMYSLGESDTAPHRGDSYSLGIDDEIGAWHWAVGYTLIRDPNIVKEGDAVRNVGLGAKVELGGGYVAEAVYTNTRNMGLRTKVEVLAASYFLPLAPQTMLSFSYHYDWSNAAQKRYSDHQLSTGIFYHFSRRTMVYGTAVWQDAQGRDAHAQINYTQSISSTHVQALARIGMMHRF